MCGFVGFTGRRSAAPVLLNGLEKLEYRGYDSAGIAVIDNGVLSVEKSIGRIKNLNDKTDCGKAVNGNIGIKNFASDRQIFRGRKHKSNNKGHLSRRQNNTFAQRAAWYLGAECTEFQTRSDRTRNYPLG